MNTTFRSLPLPFGGKIMRKSKEFLYRKYSETVHTASSPHLWMKHSHDTNQTVNLQFCPVSPLTTFALATCTADSSSVVKCQGQTKAQACVFPFPKSSGRKKQTKKVSLQGEVFCYHHWKPHICLTTTADYFGNFRKMLQTSSNQ